MPGRLIVCPTPIGNVDDLSPRARRALVEADLVACEDTRRAGRLYERLDLEHPRFVSYHEGNENDRSRQLAQQIERGARVALISDGGTPVISDPGFRLIRACLERDLEVEVLPGPSSVITALVASGLPADRWRFEGFLPRRAGELERVLSSPETVIAFESPRRLPASLAALAALAPDRSAAVCRELTKLHEEVARGTLGELAALSRRGEGRDRARDRAGRERRRLARRRLRRRRPAAAGPVRRPPAGRRVRRRGAHRDPRQRPLPGAHRSRPAPVTSAAGPD
jgi:16S rRNA (cytidine1402-2'-O)-methyltransferase